MQRVQLTLKSPSRASNSPPDTPPARNAGQSADKPDQRRIEHEVGPKSSKIAASRAPKEGL
jgi:hypothetical protein